MLINTQNPVNITRKLFRTFFYLNESIDRDEGQTIADLTTIDSPEAIFNAETFDQDLDSLSSWLDEMIIKSLKGKSSVDPCFSNYTKNIFASLISTFDIDSSNYQSVNKPERTGHIKSTLMTALDLGETDSVTSQNEYEDHLNLYSFLDQTITILSSELAIKSLVTDYLAFKKSEDIGYQSFIENSFGQTLGKSFSRLEPLFHEVFISHSKEDQVKLINLLNTLQSSFEPREEYFLATKSLFEKSRSGLIKNLYPTESFAFCSSIPQDQELSRICFENLEDTENSNTISSWLELLAKSKKVDLDERSFNTLLSLLDQYDKKGNQASKYASAEDINTKCILSILLHSNLENFTSNFKLEKILLNILVKYDNEFKFKSFDSDYYNELDKQTVLALMLLNKMKSLSTKAQQSLEVFADDDSSKLTKAASAIIRNLDKETTIDFGSLEKDFEVLRNFPKAKSTEELNQVKKSLVALAFSFVDSESINYLLPLNKNLTTANRMYHFLNTQTQTKNDSMQFEEKKNIFLNFLINMSNTEDQKLNKLAQKLFFLFPDDLIKKAFGYITNIKNPRFNALGVSTIDFFAEGNNQNLLNNYLIKNPETKTNFHITDTYNQMKQNSVSNEVLKMRIEHFESTLRALGFQFKMVA